MTIFWLDPQGPPMFPQTELALAEPEGLLAAGGALTPEWLTLAYQHGIFPWYSENEPILWWSPTPRCVFLPGSVYLSRRLKRQLRNTDNLRIKVHRHFDTVLDQCARIERPSQPGTWITRDMQHAYQTMHREGKATDLSVWSGDELLGGVYGITLGRVFFGESMFSKQSGGSKMALLALDYLMRQGWWDLVDAQVESPHLMTMGATLLERDAFEARLYRSLSSPSTFKVQPQELDIHAFLQDLTA